MPDNREIAALAWLGAAGVRVLSQQKLRESIGGVLRAFLQPLIIIPLAAMFAWIGLELWVGARLALWNVTLAKSTLLWTLGSAAVLFFNCTVPADRVHHAARRLVRQHPSHRCPTALAVHQRALASSGHRSAPRGEAIEHSVSGGGVRQARSSASPPPTSPRNARRCRRWSSAGPGIGACSGR